MASLQTRSCEPAGRFTMPLGGDVPGLAPASSSYWPVDIMQAFTLRMAAHGLCVSSAMMLGDRRYALAQLTTAHTFNDDALRGLAMALFEHVAVQHD